jgi:DNA sulfur modification protein DndE
MTVKRSTILFFLFLLLIWQCQSDQIIHVYLIGNSTMANKPVRDNPERGWGQMFGEFFRDNVKIYNHAVNGRSTKSFIDERRWETVLDSLMPNDYVFIQFGHNDQKSYDSSRYADPYGAYAKNLERFVRESRSKGAIPVLLTPVVRRRFDEQGQFYDTHGEYPGVVREVSKNMQVLLIDLHQSSRKLIISEGEENSKRIFLWVEPGKYNRFPEGKQDNTHFSIFGAREIAKLVINEIQKTDIVLKEYIIPQIKNNN